MSRQFDQFAVHSRKQPVPPLASIDGNGGDRAFDAVVDGAVLC
jgi:hypothetical protein